MTLLEIKKQLFFALDEYQDSLIDLYIPDEVFLSIDGTKSAIFCFDGHTPMDDHCGLSEHRFCLFCGQPTPNADVLA